MQLPNLPKQNKKKEADFGATLHKFYQENPTYTCAIEVKQTDKDYIPFSAVTEAQLQWALLIRSDKGVLIRIHPFIEGMPDYIYMRNEPSWICIKYAKRGFVFISPDRFILERDTSKRKSLTFKRACEISSKIIKV